MEIRVVNDFSFQGKGRREETQSFQGILQFCCYFKRFHVSWIWSSSKDALKCESPYDLLKVTSGNFVFSAKDKFASKGIFSEAPL